MSHDPFLSAATQAKGILDIWGCITQTSFVGQNPIPHCPKLLFTMPKSKQLRQPLPSKELVQDVKLLCLNVVSQISPQVSPCANELMSSFCVASLSHKDIHIPRILCWHLSPAVPNFQAPHSCNSIHSSLAEP